MKIMLDLIGLNVFHFQEGSMKLILLEGNMIICMSAMYSPCVHNSLINYLGVCTNIFHLLTQNPK